jgi:hypothetical protein
MASKIFRVSSKNRDVGTLSLTDNVMTASLDDGDPHTWVNMAGWTEQRVLEIAREKIEALGYENPHLKEIQ